ncbi:U-box domain-containing protein 6-like [Trifolium pratense]|uniref:U-box domain-containing protein 6-like n=1 Tax=Trifolium pratense TaxID=57577 RepID=UPI001E690BD6|nr:U-box domain-containing protein 6-like [Trifolium pratense]
MLPNNCSTPLEIPIPTSSKFKVHHSICIELQGFIDRILHIILSVESSRPNCTLAIQALCSLHFTLDKANLIIKHCSEASKLYLVITSHKILSRCEKVRNSFALYLTQIQNTVPISLVAEICTILHDLNHTKFSLEFEEDETRKILLSLLEKEFSDSVSMENAEVEAIQNVALRLDIKSSFSLLVEKTSLKKQLEKVNKTNQKDKELLQYLLYLLIKYGKFIFQFQNGNNVCVNQVNIMIIDSVEPIVGNL